MAQVEDSNASTWKSEQGAECKGSKVLLASKREFTHGSLNKLLLSDHETLVIYHLDSF